MSLENTLLTVHPAFTIHDWEKAEPILNKATEETKSHAGNIYYGFVRNESGDKVNCREAWIDAASLKDHLVGPNGVGGILGDLLKPGIATLDSIYVAGPAGGQLEEALQVLEPFGAVGYESHSGFVNMTSFTGDEVKPDSFVTVHPTFTILDWEKAEPILKAIVEPTRDHAGNIYYGFVKKGDTVKCRECWVDAASLKEHISGPAGVGPVLGALLEPNIAKLDSILVEAPESEFEAAKEILQPFGVEAYKVHCGVSKFSM